MPTNDERGDFARRLRELAKTSSPFLRDELIDQLKSCVFGDDYYHSSSATLLKLADLVDQGSMGDSNSLRCPMCGGEVTVFCDDYDWYRCLCEECFSEFCFDPGEYVNYARVLSDWKEEAVDAD